MNLFPLMWSAFERVLIMLREPNNFALFGAVYFGIRFVLTAVNQISVLPFKEKSLLGKQYNRRCLPALTSALNTIVF